MLIGIVGKLASGKDSVGEYLEQKGYAYVSLSEFIRHEHLKRYGVHAPDREAQIKLGNLLRKEGGDSILASFAMRHIKEQCLQKVVIGSIRTVEEAQTLKRAGFKLVALDAPQELRFERGLKRGSEKDKVSFEQFREQERQESNAIGTSMHHNKVMAMADILIQNDRTLDELRQEIDRALLELAP